MSKIPIEERFWDKVNKNGQTPDVKIYGNIGHCWDWTGSPESTGYGVLKIGIIDGKHKRIKAHRYSYKIHNGELIDNLYVCHKCDNKICVNPEHLYLGTPKDNIKDAIRTGRKSSWKNCKNPKSILTEDQVREIKSRCHNEKSTCLAKEFKVSISCIQDIKHERNWKHIK